MKKLLALVLSGVLLASSVPAYSFAAVNAAVEPTIVKGEPYPAGSQTEPTTAGLESAIYAVKEKITIPKDYTQFNYYFYDASTYSDAYWSLSWSNPDTSAYIQVNCDSKYHITYFYQYDYKNKTTGVSKYLKSELKATADEFVKKIAPETANKLEFLDASYEGVYSGNYVYNYERRNNGISFPENTASVWVNAISGKVTAASVNWLYDVTVPSSKTSITKDEAIKLIKENMKMKLVYRSNYYGIYDKTGNRTSKAFLVYEPTLSYISIDAKTGKVYLTKSQWVDTLAYGTTNEKADTANSTASDGSTTQTLTEEETAKIEELKKLITKEKAIDAVTGNSYLYLDKNLKSYTATLSKNDNSNGKTSYIWNITLSDPRAIDYEKDTDTYRAYAYATVDAQTGKILSFNASTKSYYDEKNNTWKSVKIPYNKEESKTILEKFLKSQVKDRFSNSIFATESDGYVAYYKNDVPVYGGYSYQYNRVNEGVEYPYNNITGSVDGVTGKIYSYSCYWDDSVVFESTQGAISADKAMDYYLANDDFGLKYEINVINQYDSSLTTKDSYSDYANSYKVNYEIRLVYNSDMSPAYISPFTGEQLNYNGEIYQETKPYTYSDITATPENRNILLLADMNVGFEGDKFLPDQTITIGELNGLLQDIGYSYDTSTVNDSRKDILLTREELAKMFIAQLGLEKISKLSGIYTTGYADEKNIGDDYLGAVALAKGLGLIPADADNKFNPKGTITRADAVDYIFNFISTSQSGVLY
ncbi:MAG TPA: YcdB/YcdC domain-containing protein [Mobilitalea sp.]|nr:YcdB/YcdC domain-containing protein [Mobilitalea sp.]